MKTALTLLLGSLVPSLVLAQEAPRRIDVETAVKLALDQSPGLKASRLRQEASQSSASGALGRLLPGIRLSDEFQHFDSPYALAFPIELPHAPGTPAPPSPSFPVRAQNTNTFSASASQPLLGLLHLTQDYGAARASADAASEQSLAVEAATREAVQTGFLRYFEARAAESIAHASGEQLTEQRAIAQSKLLAGVLTRADLLRLEVAIANAKQQEIQAKLQEQVTRTALLVALGLPPNDAGIELLEPTALEAAAVPTVSELDAQRTAFSRRHEVLRTLHEADAADRQSASRFFQLFPELDAEAGYVRLTGQGFAPPDSRFIGIRASWALWDWGSTFFAYRAAAHNAQAARLLVDDQRDQVRVDAANKLAQAQAAASAVEVAQAAIASAEEAWRVTDALVKAGSATTTDLLDAQSALTQARLNLVRARYEQAIAIVAFDRATGG